MKLSYSVYCRRPLGKLLPDFVRIVEASPLIIVRNLLLSSRSAREDLPREEIFSSAAGRGSDSCTIRTDRGEIESRWFYGPHAKNQTIHGVVKVNAEELPKVVELITSIARWSQAVYAFSDLAKVIDRDIAARGGSLHPNKAFYNIYWYNYFGPEFAALLDASGVQQYEGVSVEYYDDGSALLIVNAPGQTENIAEGIATQWQVFEKYSPRASMPRVNIDYSEVRSLAPAPVREPRSVGAIVGPAESFISRVEIHAERFWKWARSRQLEPKSETEFLLALRQHERVIDDEPGLLIGAIAAYGEFVRREMNGIWTKAILSHRGEPVVAKRGRPWTARRVIFEVLEAMEHEGDS